MRFLSTGRGVPSHARCAQRLSRVGVSTICACAGVCCLHALGHVGVPCPLVARQLSPYAAACAIIESSLQPGDCFWRPMQLLRLLLSGAGKFGDISFGCGLFVLKPLVASAAVCYWVPVEVQKWVCREKAHQLVRVLRCYCVVCTDACTKNKNTLYGFCAALRPRTCPAVSLFLFSAVLYSWPG
jgi:hypothetical protein